MAKKSSRGRNQDRASRFGGMARFRHPYNRFLSDGDVDDYVDFLRAGIPEQPRSRHRARARRSWDVFCELINRIERGRVLPARITSPIDMIFHGWAMRVFQA